MTPKMEPKTHPKRTPKWNPIWEQKLWFSIGFTTKTENPEPRGGKREWSAENNTSISDDPKKLMGLVALPIYFHALFIFIFLHAIFAR